MSRGWIICLGTGELGLVVSASNGVDHIVKHGAAQVLPPRAHGGHRGPLVGPRIVPLHGIQRALSVGTADGVEETVENGHSHAEAAGIHANQKSTAVVRTPRPSEPR